MNVGSLETIQKKQNQGTKIEVNCQNDKLVNCESAWKNKSANSWPECCRRLVNFGKSWPTFIEIVAKRRSICAKIASLERCRNAQILEISTHAENWICCRNNRLRHSRERALQSYVFTFSHPPDVEAQRSYIRVYLTVCWAYQSNDIFSRLYLFLQICIFFQRWSQTQRTVLARSLLCKH